MKISWQQYKDFSGPKVTGDNKYVPTSNLTHWERVFAVTAEVESSSRMGCIVSYDGTCITAGLHQAILVYPKELASEDFNSADDQGSLVHMLRLFEFIPNFPERDQLWNAFKQENWYVAPDNKIRYSAAKVLNIKGKIVSAKPGDIVFGADLRNTITPMEGKVPQSGPYWNQSVKWATLFHKVFDNPVSYPFQIKFGMDHSMHAAKSIKLFNGLTISQFIYGSTDVAEPFADCPELDMAMMLFWSNSVNAPAIAKKVLEQAIRQTGFTGYKVGNKKEFGKVLLRLLGTSDFGRWSSEVVGGRYQRTRNYMLQMSNICKLWKPECFATLGCMPKSLK